MKLSSLNAKAFEYAQWDRSDPDFPAVAVNLRDYHCSHNEHLKEATYKEIASFIDGNFLRQKIRADELKLVEFVRIDNGTIVFDVPSSEFDQNGIKYANLVQFVEWDKVGAMTDVNSREKALLLLWAGNVKLHCGCPSFLYWGYQQILTQLDAAVYPETRYPQERNPTQRGVICKHLNRVLRVLPFYSGRMAAAMKNQYGGGS